MATFHRDWSGYPGKLGGIHEAAEVNELGTAAVVLPLRHSTRADLMMPTLGEALERCT